MSSKNEIARRFERGADQIRVLAKLGIEPAKSMTDEHNRARRELDRAVQERTDRQ